VLIFYQKTYQKHYLYKLANRIDSASYLYLR